MFAVTKIVAAAAPANDSFPVAHRIYESCPPIRNLRQAGTCVRTLQVLQRCAFLKEVTISALGDIKSSVKVAL